VFPFLVGWSLRKISVGLKSIGATAGHIFECAGGMCTQTPFGVVNPTFRESEFACAVQQAAAANESPPRRR